jgi:hypothetical protein
MKKRRIGARHNERIPRRHIIAEGQNLDHVLIT